MRYEKYSPSIIRWNHDYPAHWTCEKAKRFFMNPKNLNKDNEESNILALTLRGVIRNNGSKPIGLSPSDYATYQVFDKNELVFKLIDLNNISTSRVGIVPEKGIMSSAYIRFIPRAGMDIKYFYYQYYDWYRRRIFNGLGEGVRQTLSGSDLKNLEILIPPSEEQDQIVRYLDWQVSKTNKLIEAKKIQISLLKEQLNNQVENIVLHGLSETGGQINGPIHGFQRLPYCWKVIQNKRLFSERVEHSQTGTETLLSVSKHYGVKPSEELSDDEQFATIKPAISLIGYKIVLKNDLAMNIMRARNGSYGISDYDGIVSPAYCVYQIIHPCNVKYIHYLLRTRHMKSIFEAESRGIVEHRRRLYADDFLRLYSVLPPKDEQDAIVNSVEQLNSKAGIVIQHISKQIDALHELRTRLISDVVTGQIDVRNIEVPDFELVEEIDTDEDAPNDEFESSEVNEQ